MRSSRSRSVQASSSWPSMPSVPLMSASPSFSASSTGSIPARGERVGGRAQRARPRRAPSPRPMQRERDVGERREVAGAAERAVLVHDRGDAGVEQRGERRRPSPAGRRCGRWRASTGAAASARGRPRARPPDRCRRRASGSASAAAGRAARAGCAWWPARRSRSRCRSAARRRRPAPRRRPARRRSRPSASGGELDAGAVPGDGDQFGLGDRADADGDGSLACRRTMLRDGVGPDGEWPARVPAEITHDHSAPGTLRSAACVQS